MTISIASAATSTYQKASEQITLVVVPKPTLSSVKNTAAKTVTVKWKKAAAGNGYQIAYATNKSFKSAKTVTISKLSTVSKKISKLSKKKTYYVRVRAYTTITGKKVYGPWSAAKNVKISK